MTSKNTKKIIKLDNDSDSDVDSPKKIPIKKDTDEDIVEVKEEINLAITKNSETSYKVEKTQKHKLSKKVMHFPITYRSPVINIPFGIETYNNKHILNLELYKYKENNNVYNFYCLIQQLEAQIKKVISEKYPELKSKEFISSFKERDFPILRTHLKIIRKKVITKIMRKKSNFKIEKRKIANPFGQLANTNSDILSINDLVPKSKGVVDIELRELWVHDVTYGLLWIVTSCEVY